MTNQEIARVLRTIGEYLAMKDIPFKPRAYEKVAETIEALEEDVGALYKKGGMKALEGLPGVGKSIAEHIEELLKTGRLKYYEELKKGMPIDLDTLTRVEGLGPKKIKVLYEKLHVRNLADLERAAKAGKIRKLEGFGVKSEEKILKGIGFVKSSGGRFILGFVMQDIRALENRLRNLKEVERVIVAGSVRRRKETIGDVDILAISKKPKSVMDFFVNMPEVVHVMGHGDTKSSVKLKTGMDVDLRVVPAESYGAALNYFTGSKDHNVAMRQLAIAKGLKLNEYGLFASADRRGQARGQTRTGRMVAGKTEEEIYKALGLRYIEPELRENTEELEASRRGTLPNLIGYNDLRGDLQTQSEWTDGKDSIETMAKAAAAKGLEYIAITDHTHSLTITNGLDEKRIQKQWTEIDRVNKKCQASGIKCRVLKGTECDILPDGRLDLPDAVLAKLDVVGVSVHSHVKLSRKAQTERIIRAIENPHVDILFHPTGRIVGKRPPYEVDMEAVFKAAKRTGTILEVNATERLDLKDEYVRMAVSAGVKLAINSDAHTATGIGECEFGIAQARRGWAEKKDIVNTRPLEEMRKTLK